MADFGLTENLYSKCYFREGKEVMLPVKWMAIESLRDCIFTEKTDVVSSGEYITEKEKYHSVMHHSYYLYTIVVFWSDVLGGVLFRYDAIPRSRFLQCDAFSSGRKTNGCTSECCLQSRSVSKIMS